jgi:hypothetical protein
MRVDFPAPLGPTVKVEKVSTEEVKGKGRERQRTDTDTRREGDGAGSVGELGLGGTGVGEGAVGHAEDSLGAGTDTHETTGRREDELDNLVGEGVVGAAGRVLLDEVVKVTAVVVELLLVVVNDVGADGVEETGVVGNDHRGNTLLSDEVCRGEKVSGR